MDNERHLIRVSRNGPGGDETYVITPSHDDHPNPQKLQEVAEHYLAQCREIMEELVVHGPPEAVGESPPDRPVKDQAEVDARMPDRPVVIDVGDAGRDNQKSYIDSVQNDSDIGMDLSRLMRDSVGVSEYDNPGSIRASGPDEDRVDEMMNQLSEYMTGGHLETGELQNKARELIEQAVHETREEAHEKHISTVQQFENKMIKRVKEQFGEFRNIADFLPERFAFGPKWLNNPNRYYPGVNHYHVSMSDFDNFKRINDTMGHDAGDRFIQAYSLIETAVAFNYYDRVNGISQQDFAKIMDCHPQDISVGTVLEKAGLAGDTEQALANNDLVFSANEAGGSVGVTYSDLAHNTSLAEALDEADRDVTTKKQSDQSSYRSLE